jgi:hypothetical protein
LDFAFVDPAAAVVVQTKPNAKANTDNDNLAKTAPAGASHRRFAPTSQMAAHSLQRLLGESLNSV